MKPLNNKWALLVFALSIVIILSLKRTRVLFHPKYKRPKTISCFKNEFNDSFGAFTEIKPSKFANLIFYSKGEKFKLTQNTYKYHQPSTGIIQVVNGTASTNWGLLLNKKRALIEESCEILLSYEGKRSKNWRPLNSSKATKIYGIGALIAGPYSNCYYHWLHDLLPRIELLHNSNQKFDYYILPGNLSCVQKKTLSLTLRSDVPIKYLGATNLQFDTILLPYIPTSIRFDESCRFYETHKWCLEFLKTKLGAENSNLECRERVYISRRSATRRRVLNEEAVISLLSKHGFKSYELENFSLQDQISIMKNAKVVIGIHGAGLTNLLFCKKRTKVLELFPNKFLELPFPLNSELSLYPRICELMGLDHYFLAGKTFDQNGKKPLDLNFADFEIDCLKLDEIVSIFLKEKR